jgi:outer membrane murein-binding lipoprotein Lpp
MTHRRIALALLVAGVAALAGCGGPITPDELSRSIQTLESTAAEGQLLADDVAADRTKATFARVHARDLGDVVDHEAEKLNDAEADRSDVAAAKTKAVDLADRIGTALGQIQVAPGSETDGRKAAEALGRLSEDAKTLADGL